MTASERRFAHSLPGRPEAEWEPLADHLAAVGERAAAFARAFGWHEASRAAGRLHDIGKASIAFQDYIAGAGQSVDHSTAGAIEAARLYGRFGKLLGFAIAGHHAGLADGLALNERLAGARSGSIPDYSGWDAHVEAPTVEQIARTMPTVGDHKGFATAFLVRMIFSCLVDADFLETERFYAERGQGSAVRGGFASIDDLAQRLRLYLDQITGEAPCTPLNALRATVLDHATGKAPLTPGLFTLTVPTGGGKTLTSLSFALEHARRHGLARVVYVIPYTSIIEQTAEVFRKALATDRDVLEHHANFDWEAALRTSADAADADAGQGADGLARLRRAAENWDAPIVVTTAVQFFESLFANRTSRCRKLHRLAKSVIVLDEAQTLPRHLLRPCLAAIDELSRNYGATVVLCTATQPAVRAQDGFANGLDIPGDRELAPNPPELYAALRRVAVEHRPGVTRDAEIAERFAAAPRMLCIVNSRSHARELFDLIRTLPGAKHLTTLMCPKHRREVLAEVRARLHARQPVRLVATSLVEAGVDLDFPEVWRASAGLDQLAQAAGRCNREAVLEGLGRVVVFEATEDHKAPHAFLALQQVAAGVMKRHADPLAIDAVRDYFRRLYWSVGPTAFDEAKLDGERFAILPALAERARSFDFPFKSIASAFRLIEDGSLPVIVPWDEDARRTLDHLRRGAPPTGADLRRLQQYVVPVRPGVARAWLAQGVLAPAHPELGEGMLALADLAHYNSATGLRLDDPTHRSSESNVF